MNILIIDPFCYKDKERIIESLSQFSSIKLFIYKGYEDLINDSYINGIKLNIIVFSSKNSVLLPFALMNFITYKTVFYYSEEVKSIATSKKLNLLNQQFDLRLMDYPINIDNLTKIIKDFTMKKTLNSFAVYSNKVLTLVSLEEIIFIKSVGDYVNIVTDKKHYLMYSSLKRIQDRLEDSFVRANRSCLINISHIIEISTLNIELSDGTTIPLSKSKRKEVLLKTGLKNL